MIRRDMIPRGLQPVLIKKMKYSPVILIHGPHQCGKTTLAEHVGKSQGYSYYTLDDPNIRNQARSDPKGFIGNTRTSMIIDEIQMAPELFRVIKMSVDQDGIPGRFILTGSTNLLHVPDLANALTGRMEVLHLYPLSQHEITQSHSPVFLERLFAEVFQTQRHEPLGIDLAHRMVRGGYPEALKSPSDQARTSWYRNYANALIQRDILDLEKIQLMDVIPRLLSIAASLSGQLFNMEDIASKVQISHDMMRDYMTLMERQFLINQLPPWYGNRMKRLTKKPKMHIGDSGLACTLLRVGSDSLEKNCSLLGQLLESFVVEELRRQGSYSPQDYEFYHYCDTDGVEVDLLVELSSFELAAIEVKASSKVVQSDFNGLRKIKSIEGDRLKVGVLLYDGEICSSFGDGMYAVPLRLLWDTAE